MMSERRNSRYRERREGLLRSMLWNSEKFVTASVCGCTARWQLFGLVLPPLKGVLFALGGGIQPRLGGLNSGANRGRDSKGA